MRLPLLALPLLLAAVGAPALAADVPVEGRSLRLRAGKLATLEAKSATPIPLPLPGSAEDPTVGGARLRVFDVGGGGGATTHVLDASGWKGLGKPAGSKGYQYRARADAVAPKGPCRSVRLTAKRWKARCRGGEVALSTPFDGAAAASLGLPAAGATLRYCTAFAGEAKRNDAKRLRYRSGLTPAACPVAPGELTGYHPDDVAALADDALAGRQNLSPGSEAAQAFLVAELQAFAAGLDGSQTGDDAYRQPFALGTNLLAVIPGGDLADEYVVVGAHYDHLGSSCRGSGPDDDVCNGALDNATGTALVLGVGRQIASLPTPPRRSVIVALWDAEEDGLAGSEHYAQKPLVPLADTVAYVNADLLASNLVPSLREFSIVVGTETGGPAVRALVDAAVAVEGLDTRPLSLLFGQGRSDYVNFTDRGVPTVYFTDSTNGCYHSVDDEVSVVDFAKLEKQVRIAYGVTLGLANLPERPPFVADAPAATFEDALTVHELVTRGLADLGLFAPEHQVTLQEFATQLERVVAEGPENFAPNAGTVLVGTIDVANILPSIECDGFF